MNTWYATLGVTGALMTLIACKGGEAPAKLKGASLQLADGTPISQASTDEYNPYVVKMSDGYLMLVFGSDRSCGGCNAGTHNIFVARSVAAYNDDLRLPAFNTPLVFTVAANPLNLGTAITFAVTKSGGNVRVYLNNAQGVIQYGDFVPTAGSYNAASLTSIVNAPWRKLVVIGVDEAGTGIYGRNSSGRVYWLNPDVINLTLDAMSGLGYTAVARLAPSQSLMQDGYFAVQNSTAIAASYAMSGEKLGKLQAAIDQAKLTVKALSIAHTGNAAGDLIVLSAADAGKSTQDLYLADGLTPAQLWQAVGAKPASGISTTPAAVSGLYAWYELDGNSNDSSAAGNNAFLPTAPFSGVAPAYTGTDRYGVPNAAGAFNGTTHYIGNNFLAKCDESFSVSMWIKPAQTAAQRSLLGYQTSPLANPGFTLNSEAGGGLAAQSFFNGTGANTANTYGTTAAGVLTVGQWRHLVYVNDAATRLGVIYVDGAVAATTAHAGNDCPALGGPCTCSGVSPVTGQQQWWSASPMTIGYAYRGFFSGELDQVAFFSRKLTAAEIQVLAMQ